MLKYNASHYPRICCRRSDLIVALLYLLNLTLDNGTIGGIIFYANLAAVCMLYHEFYNPSSTWFATAFLSFINLQVGMSLCFYNGMTNTVKIALLFVFPVYLLVIVARGVSRILGKGGA